MLGCDELAQLRLIWLSSPVARACYAAGTGADQALIAYLYFTADWRLAYFELGHF
jgi:hypothetical protein